MQSLIVSGVGNSTGKTSYTGSGEKLDLQSVINFVKKKSDLAPSYFILVGYSYGCIPIGALCADIPCCIGLIAISYPAGVSWALTLWNSKKFSNAIGSISKETPVLFIMVSFIY
jgi:alpha/beta superfamily hydrolase